MSIECYSKDLKGLLLWVKDTTCGWAKDSTPHLDKQSGEIILITFPVKWVKFGKSGNKKTQIKKYLRTKKAIKPVYKTKCKTEINVSHFYWGDDWKYELFKSARIVKSNEDINSE